MLICRASLNLVFADIPKYLTGGHFKEGGGGYIHQQYNIAGIIYL